VKQEKNPEIKKTFNDLGLSAKLLKAINKKGFEEPTPIQAKTIPIMLRNDTNIIAQAQTGTGKTAAFGLPLIELLDPGSKAVQALILVPTRELAIQVSEEINSLKGDKNFQIAPVYGGQSIDQQFRRLKKGVHIVVGTPGRIIDHLKRKTLKLKNIEHLILDEADEMLNMGFIDDMEEIMSHTNANKRTLLFSATIPERIKTLAGKYMAGYEFLTVKKKQLTPNLTEQIYFEVRASEKFEALCRIIDIEDNFYGLIFCKTKRDVDSVVGHLADRGYDAKAIHSDITQGQRERTLKEFKQQRVNILVATDVAARGIDVNNLSHVLNYSLPHDPEAYVHRIGRTGRAGKAGTAITFITPSEYKRLMIIQRFSKSEIKKSKVPRVQEIIAVKKKKISEDLTAVLKEEIDPEYLNWAKGLLGEHNPTEILAALLTYCFEEELNPDSYGEIGEDRPGGKRGDQRGRQLERQPDLQGKARLFVALGKKDKMNPRKLVKLILSRVPLNPQNIKDIQVMDKFSFLTVPFNKAEKIVVSFKEQGGRQLVTHAKPKGKNS